MLVAQQALRLVGGVAAIRGALIDEVALATAVTRGGHAIRLGHVERTLSQRVYPGPGDVWQMVARTAYVQLRHSPVLLLGTVAGMWVLHLQPCVSVLQGQGVERVLGGAGWVVMCALFQPTLRSYGRSPWWGAMLPGIAMFYTGATLWSAMQHLCGRGGAWKGRTYAPETPGTSGWHLLEKRA